MACTPQPHISEGESGRRAGRFTGLLDYGRVLTAGLVPEDRDFTIYWVIQAVSMIGDSFAADRVLAGPQLWLLYTVVALGSGATMVFRVAHTSMITKLVDRERLTTANGLYQAAGGAAFMLGPAAAGVIAAVFGATVAIGLNGVSFVVAAIGVLFVRVRPSRGAPEQDSAATGMNRVHYFSAGISFLRRQLVLRWLLALTAITTMLTYGLVNIFIYYVRHDLGQSETTVGLMLGAAAAGAVVAAVAAGPLRRRFGFAACWIGSYLISGLAIAALGMTTYIPVIPVIAAGFAFGTSLALVCAVSLQQELTPDHLIGRATSIFTMVQLALGAVGAIVLTTTVASFGARPVSVIVGVTIMAVAAFSICTPITTTT